MKNFIMASHGENMNHLQISLENKVVGFIQKSGKPGQRVLLTYQDEYGFTIVVAAGYLEERTSSNPYTNQKYDVWTVTDLVTFPPFFIDLIATKYISRKLFGLSLRSPRVAINHSVIVSIVEELILYGSTLSNDKSIAM